MTTLPYAIRPATTADIEAIVPQRAALYCDDPEPMAPAVTRQVLGSLLNAPDCGWVWVLCQGEAIVGYAALTIGFSLEQGGRHALLDELYILPAHRGRGLVDRVMAEVDRVCQDARLRIILLEVDRELDRLQAYYRKLGFQDRRYGLMARVVAPAEAPASGGAP